MKQILVLATVLALALTTAAVEEWQTAEDGSKYFIGTEMKYNWFEALNECTRLKMSLVAIDSLNKQLQISTMLETAYKDTIQRNLWTCGHDNAVSRRFEWLSTGQGFSYTNWNAGEPSSNAEHCLMIFSNKWIWNDAPCSTKFGFICETNPLLQEKNLELDILRKSFGTQTHQLIEKTEELGALKEAKEELMTLKKSYDLQSDQLNQLQNELNSLRKSSSSFEEKVNTNNQVIASKQSDNLAATLTKSGELDQLKTLEIDNAVQANLLKVKTEELAAAKTKNDYLLGQVIYDKNYILHALVKTFEIQTNRTSYK